MGFNLAELPQIQAIINPMLGQKAWGVALGVGSFVTLEFGSQLPQQPDQNRSHGEWHLWVYCCAWHLTGGDELLAASEDARSKLEQAIKRLEGLAVQSIQIVPPSLETVISFETGMVLKLFPIFSEEFEHWMLYTPEGKVLTLGPGTRWSYTSSSQIPT